MKRKLSICVFVFIFLVFGSGWAKEFHAGTDGEAPLVKLWERSYSTGFNWLMDLAIDSNDNIIVTGWNDGTATIKYDSDGEVLWTETDSSVESAWAVTIDSSDNIIVGATKSIDFYTIDFCTIKYSPDGDIVEPWPKSYDNSGNADSVRSVACDGDDNIIVLGETYRTDIPCSPYWLLVKYDKDGKELWNKTFTNSAYDALYSEAVVVDSNNNIVLAGYARIGSYPFEIITDIIIMKCTVDGDMFWQEPIVYHSVSGNSYANALCVDKDDNIMIAGKRNDYLYVQKYDAAGTFIWDVEETSAPSAAYAITTNKNDRILVGGTIQGTEEEKDMNYMICYDASGNKLWDFAHNPTQWRDAIYGLAVDSDNNIGVGSFTDGVYLTEKYKYMACEGDIDKDRDVDGSDLAQLAADPGLLQLSLFAADFGRTDCL
jgi:hypothetical protein